MAQFQSTIAMTISFGKRLALFQTEIVALSETHPALKHTIISLTLMHDRHQAVWSKPGRNRPINIPPLSEHEIGHWYLATSCFNADLASALKNTTPLDIRQQAALCATSVLLVVLTFCYVEARTPEEAWPLAGGPSPSTSEDLQWIGMSNGKMSAQSLTRGLATDPVFRHLVLGNEQDKGAFPSYMTTPAIEGECFQELEQLVSGPGIEALTRSANSTCLITIIFSFWSFVGEMTVEFEDSLRKKQPEALLLLRINTISVDKHIAIVDGHPATDISVDPFTRRRMIVARINATKTTVLLNWKMIPERVTLAPCAICL
ncbi:hypothetical protein H2200_009955 [Cladophialophora chaetospira]|uniref:Uncharacterized protein n=1 Tax=Cladophialophora chaetospira TaxID=386627 RepID=A0AA38X1W8_9EURO|nr:hypothetical protein H2200_009955 [Cladophialophora chaetospira]